MRTPARKAEGFELDYGNHGVARGLRYKGRTITSSVLNDLDAHYIGTLSIIAARRTGLSDKAMFPVMMEPHNRRVALMEAIQQLKLNAFVDRRGKTVPHPELQRALRHANSLLPRVTAREARDILETSRTWAEEHFGADNEYSRLIPFYAEYMIEHGYSNGRRVMKALRRQTR